MRRKGSLDCSITLWPEAFLPLDRRVFRAAVLGHAMVLLTRNMGRLAERHAHRADHQRRFGSREVDFIDRPLAGDVAVDCTAVPALRDDLKLVGPRRMGEAGCILAVPGKDVRSAVGCPE